MVAINSTFIISFVKRIFAITLGMRESILTSIAALGFPLFRYNALLTSVRLLLLEQ